MDPDTRIRTLEFRIRNWISQKFRNLEVTLEKRGGQDPDLGQIIKDPDPGCLTDEPLLFVRPDQT